MEGEETSILSKQLDLVKEKCLTDDQLRCTFEIFHLRLCECCQKPDITVRDILRPLVIEYFMAKQYLFSFDLENFSMPAEDWQKVPFHETHAEDGVGSYNFFVRTIRRRPSYTFATRITKIEEGVILNFWNPYVDFCDVVSMWIPITYLNSLVGHLNNDDIYEAHGAFCTIYKTFLEPSIGVVLPICPQNI